METPATGSSGLETTGRFIITFREGAQTEALGALRKSAGLAKAKVMTSSDFGDKGVDIGQIAESGGAVFEQLGIAVVNVDPSAAGELAIAAGEDSSILAVEPEGVMYALGDSAALPLDYLRGFRDAAEALYERAARGEADTGGVEPAATFADTASLTWGLQATKVAASRYSGKGIKIAVLDTGHELQHPDYAGRAIVSRSFVAGVSSPDDGHGHGTHCVGTACGPLAPSTGRRYGVAYRSLIHVGKVLSDQGSGVDAGILAGIDWAVAAKCPVISMSLGANVQTTSVAYETAGQRALNAGCLIVAAAGNNARRSQGNFGFVGRPANSRSFMAVAAVDAGLRIADFSARDTVRTAGTAVDIAGPGVAVYSSWLLPARYRSISGTSMATPHVAGIAALFAEATGARGAALWQRVVGAASLLGAPVNDVGRGLVQAP